MVHYDHVDMHKLTPTIEEVIALTILGYVAIFGLLKQLSPQLQNLCKFAHLWIMISGTNSILEVETNSV
jgi:hypothetical protein